MKNIVTLLISVLLVGCAAPKYTYYFDHYDYNSGKRKAMEEKALLAVNASPMVNEMAETTESPLILPKEVAVSSASAGIDGTPAKKTDISLERVAVEKKYTDMTKAEKKEFRKTLKTEVKKYVKAKKSGEEFKSVADTKAMDYNLKMAIIFGAVALTLSFFGGVNSVFWIISVVSLVVGVVFFIKWIAEQ